jgi:hypothetical protein
MAAKAKNFIILKFLKAKMDWAFKVDDYEEIPTLWLIENDVNGLARVWYPNDGYSNDAIVKMKNFGVDNPVTPLEIENKDFVELTDVKIVGYSSTNSIHKSVE